MAVPTPVPSLTSKKRRATVPAGRSSIARFILRRLALTWVFLLLVGCAVVLGILEHSRDARLEAAAQAELTGIEALHGSIVGQQATLRGYLLTGSRRELMQHHEAGSAVPRHASLLRAGLAKLPSAEAQRHRAYLARIESLTSAWLDAIAHPAVLAYQTDPFTPVDELRLQRGDLLLDEVLGTLQTYRAEVEQRRDLFETRSARTLATVLIVAVAGLLAAVLVSVRAARRLGRELNGTFAELASAAQELSAGRLRRRVPPGHLAETAALADRFNVMADTLHRRNEELRRSLEYSNLIVNGTGMLIVVVDTQGRIVRFNPACEALTGHAAQEVLGRPYWEVVLPYEKQCAAREAFARVCAEHDREIEPYESTWLSRSGTRARIAWRNSKVTGAGGELLYLIGAGVDISGRIAAERELRQANEELRRSNAELEQFAYVASHDLQGPLRTVTSFTQLLQLRYDAQLDDQGRMYTRYITDSARRMKDLIEDLLSFAQIAQQERPLDDVNLGSIMNAVRADLAGPLGDAHATVTVSPLPVVSGDAAQLAQVLQNLLLNAVRYRHPEREPEIGVHAERHGAAWYVTVADNGIGIEEQHHERIFQVFQRLHRQDQIPGTGIGLSICKKIVERHGGRIWVQSTPGEGSTFCFTLPATDA